MIIIYMTASDEKEAKAISRTLLEKKLIGCANMFPIQSMYWWKEIQEDNEYVVLLKTSEEKYEEIEKTIKDMHSYDVPAIYAWPANKVSAPYLRWIEDCMQ